MADVSLMELEEELEEEHLLGLAVLGESHVIQPLEASLESPCLAYIFGGPYLSECQLQSPQ